jgi:signal transduction histidine kinase
MDALTRHLFLPLAVTVIATNVVLLGVFTLLALRPPEDTTTVPLSVFCIGVVIFLALAVRGRRRRRREIAEFTVKLARGAGAGALRDALAEAAGDPNLELAYWRARPEGWVDLAGQAVTLPESGRLVTIAHYRGRPSAAVICDPVLAIQTGVLDAALSAVSLSLENERLQAELRAYVDELRESRMRIATASDAERVRVGRDLHDGAQQRLIAIKLMLDTFAARADRGEGVGADEFARAGAELESVVDEIRAVSAGLNPPVLAQRGLASALEFAASRSPVPVRLQVDLPDDPPEPARSAVYFMVTELLTNVAKHSAAGAAVVSVGAVDGELRVEVSDDGVGGAEPRPGSGLVGLSDRAEALGGSLRVMGINGGGTRVQARVPIA